MLIKESQNKLTADGFNTFTNKIRWGRGILHHAVQLLNKDSLADKTTPTFSFDHTNRINQVDDLGRSFKIKNYKLILFG
jgi:hypothetical protein